MTKISSQIDSPESILFGPMVWTSQRDICTKMTASRLSSAWDGVEENEIPGVLIEEDESGG